MPSCTSCYSASSFPDRHAYGWLAAGAIALAFYGSLIPFTLHPVPLQEAWATSLDLLFDPPPRRLSRSNFLANILLFVPIGFGLMGMLLADRRSRWAVVPAMLATLVVSLSVSLTVEFLQIFTADRVPSRIDVGGQVIGWAIGVAVWIVAGPALTRWIRETAGAAGVDRLTRALAMYGAAWMFVNLAPFDITLDAGHIARRIREGAITLVPYAHPSLTGWRIVWDAFATAVSAAPIGVLALVGGMAPGRRRSAGAAFGLGAALVMALEAAQVFIRSHAADSGDVLSGAAGVGLGVWAGRRILQRAGEAGEMLPTGRRWAVAALAGWCCLICAYHWMPFDFELDFDAIERKLDAVSLIPFSGYWSGSYLNALNDLLVKLGLSMPLGIGIAFAFARRGTLATPVIAAALLGAGLLFTIVEAGQLFVPSRVPGPTDVLIGTGGVALGLWFGRWVSPDG